MSGGRPASTALRLLGVGAALVGTIVALLRVDGGLLPWPRSLAEAAGDVRQADPLVVAFSLGRGLAIGLCGYVLLTTVLGLLARLAGLRRAVGLLDACSPQVVRRLLRGVATLGAVATLGTALGTPAFALGAAAEPTSATTAPDRPPVLHRLPDDTGPAPSEPVAPPPSADPTTTTTATPTVPPAPDPPPTTTPPAAAPVARARLHELDDPPPTPRPTPTPAPAAPDPPTRTPPPPVPTPSTQPAAPSPASSAAVAPEWVIAPGDHLWHVSVTTLASAWGRPPTDAETVTYLHALIERNQAVFAVPGHPDLVFPGQRFALPVP